MNDAPAWVNDALAAVMLASSGYYLARIWAAWRWKRSMHYDINLAHVAMGLVMAGMLMPGARTLPDAVSDVVFVGFSAWFVARAARLVRDRGLDGWDEDGTHHVSHFLTHLLMVGAMLFMLLAQRSMPDAGGNVHVRAMTAGMPVAAAGGAGSVFAYLLVVVLLVSAVWHADGLSRFEPAAAGDGAGATGGSEGAGIAGGTRLLAPRLEATGHVVMCLVMGYMLVLMR